MTSQMETYDPQSRRIIFLRFCKALHIKMFIFAFRKSIVRICKYFLNLLASKRLSQINSFSLITSVTSTKAFFLM